MFWVLALCQNNIDGTVGCVCVSLYTEIQSNSSSTDQAAGNENYF